jgi:hypothetical protein
MNYLNCKDFGVKKNGKEWRTYANVSDGTKMGMMPINWASGLFKTKEEAKKSIETLATEWGWKK